MNRILFKIALLASLVFVCQVSFAQQRNGIFIDDYMTRPEITVNVPVVMVNDFNVCGFQCDITLPEGFDIAKDEYGDYDFKLPNRAEDHILASNFTQGVYRVLAYSLNNSYFSGNSGELFTIPLYVKAGVKDGKYEVKIDNIEITDVEYYERPEGGVCFINVDKNSSVATVDFDAVSIKSVDGKIHISGAENGSVVDVFDISGRLVKSKIINGDKEIISGLANGIYIVKTGTICKKVTI